MKVLCDKARTVFGPFQIVLGLLLLAAAIISLRPWTWRGRGCAED